MGEGDRSRGSSGQAETPPQELALERGPGGGWWLRRLGEDRLYLPGDDDLLVLLKLTTRALLAARDEAEVALAGHQRDCPACGSERDDPCDSGAPMLTRLEGLEKELGW